MTTFYKNKQLAYECILQEMKTDLDIRKYECYRRLYPEKFLGVPADLGLFAPRQPVNTGFVSAQHPPKVIPPMSSSTRDEKIE